MADIPVTVAKSMKTIELHYSMIQFLIFCINTCSSATLITAFSFLLCISIRIPGNVISLVLLQKLRFRLMCCHLTSLFYLILFHLGDK